MITSSHAHGRASTLTVLLTVLLTLALLLSGCAGGGDSGDAAEARTAKAAEGAASDYAEDLRAFADSLSTAVTKRKPTRDKTGTRVWPDLRDVLVDPPALEGVEGGTEASKEYAAASEIATRVAAFRKELVALQSVGRALPAAAGDLYSAYIKNYGPLLKLDRAIFDRLSAMGVLDFDKTPAQQKRLEVQVPRAWLASEKKVIANLRTYRRTLARITLPGPFGRSIAAYMGEESAQALALHEEFVDYLRTTPPRKSNVGLYNKRVNKANLLYDAAASAAWKRRGTLTSGLAAGVAALARQAGAGTVDPAGPFAGDPYRAAILKTAAKRPKAAEQGRWLVDQLWLLHRVREIEETPEEAYSEARSTIVLQEINEDPRNYYGTLLAVLSGLDGIYPGSPDAGDFAAYKRWALDQLSRPAPALLEQTRAQFAGALEKVPTTGSYERRWAAWQQMRDRTTRAMKRGARQLDSRRTLAAAVKRAVEGTRPGADR